MTWTTQYTKSLPDNGSALGQDFNYIVEIPAIGGSGEQIRIGLRGPSVGSSRVQAMYIGHGSGYSFDGNQVEVTVGGQSSFTLTSGVVYSDPIDTSAFGFSGANKLYFAYELLQGDYYRRNFSLGSSYTLHFKTGSGDAATTSKSGYTTTTGRSAIVDSIDLFQDATEPLPPEEDMDNHLQVLNGERHSSGGEVAGQTDKHLHVQFRNPSGTGKTGLLYEVEITPDADTVMTLRSYNDAIGTAFPKCNLMFAAGPSGMEARYSQENTILGNFHSIHKLKANERNIIHLDVPLVGLEAGRGVVVALHSKNVGAVVNVQWREVAN